MQSAPQLIPSRDPEAIASANAATSETKETIDVRFGSHAAWVREHWPGMIPVPVKPGAKAPDVICWPKELPPPEKYEAWTRRGSFPCPSASRSGRGGSF